jgi:hypothetical protein
VASRAQAGHPRPVAALDRAFYLTAIMAGLRKVPGDKLDSGRVVAAIEARSAANDGKLSPSPDVRTALTSTWRRS